MNGAIPNLILVVHPTSLALRQLQRRALEQAGFFDARWHTTLAALLGDCAEAARRTGLLGALRPASDLDLELLLMEAARRFQARPEKARGPLAALSAQALEDTLDQLNAFLPPLADRVGDAVAWLAGSEPKNRALAKLCEDFQTCAHAAGVATGAEINAAILGLLRGQRAAWPGALREADAIRFVGVRSITPMLEAVSGVLAAQLGGDRVQIEHILEQHEQEWWGEKFLTGSCQLLFGAECAAEDAACHAPQTWGVVSELREAYAMRDPGLAAEARAHLGFSCSAGLYGEVEDLARRILWELEQPRAQLRPEDIALVVPNVGRYSDAIENIFRRFQLPYHFRRGRAVPSAPVAQAILRILEVRANRNRDALCALLESPWIAWETIKHGGWEMVHEEGQIPGSSSTIPHSPSTIHHASSTMLLSPSAVADAIRRAGIEPELPEPGVLGARVRNFLLGRRVPAAQAQALGALAAQALRLIGGAAAPGQLSAACTHFSSELRSALGVEHSVRAFVQASAEGDNLTRQAALFNSRAFATVLAQLDALGQRGSADTVTWGGLLELLRRVLHNVTVAAGTTDEAGIWILNPHDVAGLNFRLVLVAGLNAGVFPGLPAPSPVLSDEELTDLRQALPGLPRTTLAPSVARRSQDHLLFLTTLAAASERLVFSYQCRDETGEELEPSICFATAWRLAGWPSWETLPELPPDPYDRWRLEVAPHIFSAFWEAALAGKNTPAWQRTPFYGESFLATLPPALCRARDEALQQAARSLTSEAAPADRTLDTGRSPDPAGHAADTVSELVARSLAMEAERTRLFTQSALQGGGLGAATAGAKFIGAIAKATWQKVRRTPRDIPDFSATELETLATCPYKFYLQRVLRLEPLQTNEMEATPMALGSLVHRVMHHALLLLRGDELTATEDATDEKPGQGVPPARDRNGSAGGVALPGRGLDLDPGLAQALGAIRRRFAHLCRPAFATQSADLMWHIAATGSGRPVVQFQPDQSEDYAEFIAAVADAELEAEEQALEGMMLGAIEQRGVVRTNLVAGCRNLLRLSLQAAEFKGCDLPALRRYPALLEFTFRSDDTGEKSSIEFVHPDDVVNRLRVHGKVDRVDLLADDDGVVRALNVVDYKGVSKSGLKPEELAGEIVAARNCQLPVYGLVAQATFGHELPLLLQYQPYRGDFSDIVKGVAKNWITLAGEPVPPDVLTELIGAPQTPLMVAFTRRIFQCLEILESGAFMAQPQECGHCDFRGCCRYTAPALAAEDGEAAE